jgi:heparin binding hemagglutinin HbhA
MAALLPTTEDVRKAREQAVAVLNTAAESVRTPLLAALGAGDLATQAVIDAVNKARTKVNEGTTSAKETVDTLPKDLAGLREKVDAAELRKLVDEYTEAAQKLYHKLADQGEDALAKLKSDPRVGKAIDQLEESIATLQERVGDVAGDARELAEEVLSKVTRRTRVVGEKTASAVERVTEDAALTVEEVGGEVASDVRNASRKAASRTAPRKPAATRSAAATQATPTTPATRKTNGSPKTAK